MIMGHGGIRFLLCAYWFVACLAHAQTTIFWSSDGKHTNVTSTGAAFDGRFKFELGVFAAPFVPTKDNTGEWAAHWRTVSLKCRTTYNPNTWMVVASFTPTNNDAPFVANAPAYIWGFRGDALSAEWILFRKSSWKWPDASSSPPSSSPPSPTSWLVQEADTVVLGALHASGSPFLMQSAAVTHARPPDTSWLQWQADDLAGVVLNGPQDDPDRDGVSNLLEFVFGTSPMESGVMPVLPLAVVGGHVQITVPRRIDRPAALTVEVSSDLKNWQSGSGATTEEANTLAAWMVRDQSVLGAAHPRRFIRLKVEPIAP
ncbi:MAG: hypothetical protein RLZZ282_145 [Verrucomicrobiota bacterium]